MKKICILIFILCSQLCVAQNLSFSQVIPVDGKSADDIYNATKAWSATAFANAKYSTQVDNPEGHFISFNSNIPYSYGTLVMAAYDGWINFTLTVQSKDGRFKIEMTNIAHENKPTATSSCELGFIREDEGSYKGFDKKVAPDIIQKSTALFDSLSSSLYESMQKSIDSEEDDW